MSPMMAIWLCKDDLLILDNMGDLDFRRMRIRLGDFSQDIIEIRIQHPSIRSSLTKYGESPVRSLELTTEDCFPTVSYISYDQQGEPIPRE